jgi:hypothetical protein
VSACDSYSGSDHRECTEQRAKSRLSSHFASSLLAARRSLHRNGSGFRCQVIREKVLLMFLELSRSSTAVFLLVTACAPASPPAAPSAPAAAPGSGSASGAASAGPAGPELAVPFGAAPTVDGTVGEAEWARAATVALERGVMLRFLHDGERVYMAISGLAPPESAFACLLIAEPEHIRVLHASAKLGSAIYTAGADQRYQPRSKTYAWRPGEELMRDEGWLATTVSEANRRQQEFALTFAALGLPDRARRIALGYFHVDPAARPAQPGAMVWPAGLDDAVANVQLLGGFNPDALSFEPSRWVVLRPQPR